MTCCFTGHRVIPSADVATLKEKLSSTIDELIDEGVTYFVSGGALGFDTIVAEMLIEKKKTKDIFIEIAVPCKGQEAKWNVSQKEKYKNFLENADKVTVLAERYITGCMQMRNMYMVDKSDVLVAYYRGRTGGTQKTFLYAEGLGKRIINI